MTSNGIEVLIAEDDAVIRRAFAELLTHWGFTTRTARNGVDALVEIDLEKPDILLSDLEMPGMNGYELLSMVRRRHPEIPLVAMSGRYAGDSVPPGVKADAFYAKGSGECARLHSILKRMAEAALWRGSGMAPEPKSETASPPVHW